MEATTENFDIGSAVESIGADIFSGQGDDEPASTPRQQQTDDVELRVDAEDLKQATDAAAASEQGTQTTEAPTETPAADAIAMPQSWRKDMGPVWEKMPREAQQYYMEREQQMLTGLQGYKTDAEYGRGMREAVTPYMGIIQQQGLQPAQAVHYLLNAHAMLSNPQTARDTFLKMAERYGVDLNALNPGAGQQPDGQSAQPLPPEVRALQERVNELSGVLTQQQRERYEAAKQATSKEVETFASDPKNPYFDECADHICQLLAANPQLALKDAYDQAVWANPVTRAKELARIGKEQEAARNKQAQEAAQQARKATVVNVRGRDSVRAPTEPTGTMEDTLRETLADIHTRA